MTRTFVQAFAWSLASLTVIIAVVAWGQDYDWQVTPFDNYLYFPLFGLLAFSIMWSHYVAGAIREMAGFDKPTLAPYFHRTSYAVLILLFLHPGLFMYQLFRDGLGLPPGSYSQYVGPGLSWLVLLGVVSLLVFLAFEFHRLYSHKKWWRYVADASDIAMLAIVYHGLRLGSQLEGWFLAVWWFYAVVLVAVLIRKYYLRFTEAKTPGEPGA